MFFASISSSIPLSLGEIPIFSSTFENANLSGLFFTCFTNSSNTSYTSPILINHFTHDLIVTQCPMAYKRIDCQTKYPSIPLRKCFRCHLETYFQSLFALVREHLFSLNNISSVF
eukprot:TRINITY_DN3381_c0_g1_i8.p1 TRINITY_DN3381_c0_g1~~TRINITY_DN3381_c0_g1_i8.p1  ORF type:complete len:115 (-),score=5.46 TRINITY_DN3381_c0_g1_i8:396-740(-)